MKLAGALKRQLTAPFSLQHLPNTHIFPRHSRKAAEKSAAERLPAPRCLLGLKSSCLCLGVESLEQGTALDTLIMFYALGWNFFEAMGHRVFHHLLR